MACQVRARCADDKQRSSAPRRAPELVAGAEDHPEPRLAAQHALVTLGNLLQRDDLIHRPHTRQHAERKGVLRICGCARIPPLNAVTSADSEDTLSFSVLTG